MLATLLYQLRSVQVEFSSSLYSAYLNACQLGRQTVSEAEAVNCFVNIAQSQTHCSTIVLDGLDESSECSKIITLLLRVKKPTCNLRILVLSRDIPELRRAFQGHQSIYMSKATTKPDIDSYVQREIRSLALQSETKTTDEVVQQLQDGADGSFLWAKIIIQKLQGAVSPAHTSEILDAKTDIDELFSKSLWQLARLPKRQREVVQKAVYWVCCARKPLTLEQLQSAVAIRINDGNFDGRHKPFSQTMRKLISPILSIREVTDTVKPLHASVIEYLTSSLPVEKATDPEIAYFLVDKPHRDGEIALQSITLIQTFLRSPCSTTSLDQEPLFSYCALFWLEHLLASPRHDEAAEKVVSFLASESRQRWLSYWLLKQRQVFPFAQILYLREQLRKWLGTSVTETSTSYLNWDHDICNALVELSAEHERDKLASSNPDQSDGPAEFRHDRLTHFEKMMIVRDLARHLTQHNTLSHGIELFEQKLMINEDATESSKAGQIWLMNTLGIFYDQAAHSDLATKTQEDALEVLLTSLPAAPKAEGAAESRIRAKLIWTRNELGRMYRHQRRFELAEQMHLETLQALISEPSSADDFAHRMEVAWTQSTLARVYRCQHAYGSALAYSAASYATRTELLGPSHPHSLWIQSDMAQMHLGQRDYGEAIELHRRVLVGRRDVLGDNNLDTCWTMNNLGVALTMQATQEALREARALHEEALTVQERILGSDHPHTLWTRGKLDELENGW